MRGAMTLLASLLATATLSAQEGVFAIHPASNPGGKWLTMEETILSRNVYPARYPAERGSRPEGLPKGASDITPKAGAGCAYTIGKALYYNDPTGKQHTIAAETDPEITFGQSVSRNEFGIGEGIYWSPDGKKIAFYRKDESRVTSFPLLDITTRTGSPVPIKYPMNGMQSEEIRLGIFNLADSTTVYVQADDFGYDRYLTNISWSPDGENVFIQVLDRSQKHMRLNMYRASDGSFVRTLLTEDNPRYIEPSDPVRFLGQTGFFLYRTDNRDGYRNLYLCDTLGGIRRLTAVDADVAYLADNGQSVFYTSAEISPVENHLFRIDVSPARGKKAGRLDKVTFGKPVQLTAGEGWHSVSMNADCTEFIDRYISFNVPGITVRKRVDGRKVDTLLVSANPLEGYATPEMMLGTVRSADGKYDNWYRLYKPVGFDPAKKYPVIVYVYGGPHSQMVQDSWLGGIRMWEMYMAQRGYVVYVQDNRGTSNRGAEYEKAIHRRCGQAEMEDQMEGIRMLTSLPWVDSDRIGVHGWSYGGFMTISLMTHYPETFKVGVAGGPVIDWKWYEIMYGERYMETEATNPEGFAQTSLIGQAANLKGKLLICQGAIDNTVVWEHSLSFVQKCIEENVQVDYFPYPLSEHNVYGRWRVHLMDKVTMYFEDYL